VQRGFQNYIRLGKEINQFSDTPTDIAQLAHKSEVGR